MLRFCCQHVPPVLFSCRGLQVGCKEYYCFYNYLRNLTALRQTYCLLSGEIGVYLGGNWVLWAMSCMQPREKRQQGKQTYAPPGIHESPKNHHLPPQFNESGGTSTDTKSPTREQHPNCNFHHHQSVLHRKTTSHAASHSTIHRQGAMLPCP